MVEKIGLTHLQCKNSHHVVMLGDVSKGNHIHDRYLHVIELKIQKGTNVCKLSHAIPLLELI